VLQYITTAFNDKNVISIDIIFLDFSNAFNCVPHFALFKKLSKIGISGSFLKIIIDSFKNRKEFISYNNCNSNPYCIKVGIPQGQVSSPIYFNIYKSDLIECIKYSKLYEFADDTVLVKIIKNNDDRKQLQSDLNNISQWCSENELSLNPNKTELLNIHTKYEYITSLYKINKTFIKTVESHKHLGIYLDKKLNFNLNTEEVISKSFKKWGILKFICKNHDSDIFLSLYKTFILPKLEYSNLIFTLNNNNMEKIEKVQRNITKFISYKMAKNDSKLY